MQKPHYTTLVNCINIQFTRITVKRCIYNNNIATKTDFTELNTTLSSTTSDGNREILRNFSKIPTIDTE